MSDLAQRQFLANLDKRLKKSSKAYRKATANKLAHNFLLSKNALLSAIGRAVDEAVNLKNKNVVNKNIETATETFIDDVHKRFTDYSGPEYIIKNIKKSKDRFQVDVLTKKGSNKDIFRFIQRRYTPALQTYFDAIVKELKGGENNENLKKGTTVQFKNKKGEERDITVGSIFSLEHNNAGNLEQGSSNIVKFKEQQIAETVSRSKVLGKIDQAGLDQIGALLGVERFQDIKKPTEVKVFLGSTFKNTDESIKERAFAAELRRDIEAELKRLDLTSLEGSDSIDVVERKRVEHKIQKVHEKTIAKTKNIRTKFNPDTKVKKLNGNSTSLKVGGTVTKGATGSSKAKVKGAKSRSGQRTKAAGQQASFTSLIPLINGKLPGVLAKNMKSPALNYRTGRFASSAEVTDISVTPGGFPSIGYTYQKNPYQTFEVGFDQGSVDRDPRKLIQNSIREIITEYAVGRFYFRRN